MKKEMEIRILTVVGIIAAIVALGIAPITSLAGCDGTPDMETLAAPEPPSATQPPTASAKPLPPPAGPIQSNFKGCKIDKTVDLGEGYIGRIAANNAGFIANWQDQSAAKTAAPYALQTFGYDGNPMSDKMRQSASQIVAGKNDFLLTDSVVLNPKVSNGINWVAQRISPTGTMSSPISLPSTPMMAPENDNYRLAVTATNAASACSLEFKTGLITKNGYLGQDDYILNPYGCFQATEGVWIQDLYKINDLVMVGARQTVWPTIISQYHLAVLSTNYGHAWYNLNNGGRFVNQSFGLKGEVALVWHDKSQNQFLSTMELTFGPGLLKTTYKLPEHFTFNYFDGELLIGLIRDNSEEKFYLARVAPNGALVDKVELPADYAPEFSIAGKNGRYVVMTATTGMVASFKMPEVKVHIVSCN